MKAGFFTTSPSRGYIVPHDRIGARWILVVHQAITRSFEMLRSDGVVLNTALENDITERLEDILENRVRGRGEVAGFDGLFFGRVTRGSETVNHDGTKKSKKPDLIFQLRREHRREWDQRQDALFAECKPVDRSHPLAGHYCAVGKDCTGVERFVVGDYAWAMEEALMIGYVRDGLLIEPDLKKALYDKARHSKLGAPQELVVVVQAETGATGVKPALYRSTHQRRFLWASGKPATPIELYHSWHDCS